MVGVTVILPSLASGQLVCTLEMVAVNVVLPAATFTVIEPEQLMASTKVTVCGPGVTLVKVLLACGVPPSSENI